MRNLFRARRGETGRGSASPLHGKIIVALGILVLAALFVASGARTAIAQSGGGYDLTLSQMLA